eukprot:g24827.t1
MELQGVILLRYINRATYDAVDQSGRILIKMIELLGMMKLEPLWNLKLFIETRRSKRSFGSDMFRESIPVPFSTIICDKFLWWFNNILPKSLPKELQQLADEFDTWHEVAEVTQVDELMSRLEKFQSKHPGTVRFHVCDNAFSASRAMLFRFAVAPAFRTYCIGLGLQGLSIDYALPKTFKEYPTLPEAMYPIQHRLVYSHFGCNVYHEDFVFDNQTNVHDAKMAIKKAVEAVGGKLPAEHGHGTEYKAPMDTQRRWMKADPSNTMNPGVGA